MVLTKLWLQQEIDSEPNPAIKLALERVFQKYTQPPGKENKPLKEFDTDKVFRDTVKFYVDKKDYTLEQAEEIAKAVVNREKQRRGIPL